MSAVLFEADPLGRGARSGPRAALSKQATLRHHSSSRPDDVSVCSSCFKSKKIPRKLSSDQPGDTYTRTETLGRDNSGLQQVYAEFCHAIKAQELYEVVVVVVEEEEEEEEESKSEAPEEKGPEHQEEMTLSVD